MTFIYKDKLITLTEEEIVYQHYYFPTGKKKVVRLADIEEITVRLPNIWNGRWRIQGTGDFKTWFPRDIHRPRRSRIFFATLKGRWIQIGFTVENAEQVERLLREKKLIKTERPSGGMKQE